MTLESTLSSMLQGSGIQQTLFETLAAPPTDGSLSVGPEQALAAFTVPIDGAQLSDLAGRTNQFSTENVGAALSRLAERATPLVASLPGVGDVLGPLNGALATLEQLSTQDVAATLRDLASRVGAEFDGSTEGGLSGRLLRIATLLSEAGAGTSLLDLLGQLLRPTGLDLPRLPVTETFRVVDGTARAFGGLMMLETVLAEAERLSGILSRQLDAAHITAQIDGLEAALSLGPVTLADFVTSVAPNDPATVAAATNAVLAFATSLDALRDDVAAGFGLGEATLVYMKPEVILAETELALSLMRGADTDGLQRLLVPVAEKLSFVLALDLQNIPARGLDELLNEATAKTTELAASLNALDVAGLVSPVSSAIGSVSSFLGDVDRVIDQTLVSFRGLMGQVRDAIAALPFGEISEALRRALEPVTAALDAIRALVAGVEEALDQAAAHVNLVLGHVEGALDTFAAAFDSLFVEAKGFIQQLNLDQLLGAVSDQVRAFADVLARAQMKPYFDTAVDAIGTTAQVVSAIPFSVLPDSVKAEVEEAARPVREVDVGAVALQIESLLQITPDGKFALRGEIEQAISSIEEEYKAVIAAVESLNPRTYLHDVDQKLEELAGKVRGFSPELTLAPVREAVDQVKAAIVGFDLSSYLAPVRDVFAQILAGIDQYSPVTLIQPLQEQLVRVRQSIIDAIRLDEWVPELDLLMARAGTLLSMVAPEFLEAQLGAILSEVSAAVGNAGRRASAGLGTLLVGLLNGIGLKIEPGSVDRVLAWFDTGPTPDGAPRLTGTAESNARAARIAESVLRTRAAVAELDVTALSARLVAGVRPLRIAVETLAAALPEAEPNRQRLLEALPSLDAAVAFGQIGSNRARYLALLESSVSSAETLRRTGYSEVDVTIAKVRAGLSPLAPHARVVRQVLSLIGLSNFEGGVAGVLSSLLNVLTAERLVGIASPLLMALKGRVEALLNAVLTPIRDSIAEISTLIGRLDLTPLADAMQLVVDEVKQQVLALHPDTLLGAPLAAFEALKQELVDDDPLARVMGIVADVKATIERVLGKLSLEVLLQSPLAIYDHILAELKKLHLDGLLDPIFEQLDAIAAQVDEGLDGTVVAFRQLQAALPGGDGASASAELSVGAG